MSGEGLFSRNWAFIDADLQRRLDTTTLLVAGVGLGSVVAELAVRTGVGRVVVADGDRVEASNLNRQAYDRRDLAGNKARRCALRLRAIRPDLEVRVIDRFLDVADVRALAADADVVVDTIDWDHPAQLELIEAGRGHGVPVLFPMNVGWGGVVLCFVPGGQSPSEVLGTPPDGAHAASWWKRTFIEHATRDHPDPEVRRVVAELEREGAEPWLCDPQLGVAAAMTAGLVVTTVARLVAGRPVRSFPDVIGADAWTACAPRESRSA